MEKTNIVIPNPCNKDWDKMTTNSNGKHCSSCKKTVVDFTKMEVDEIKEYIGNRSESVCGHFNNTQVSINRPKHHQFLVDLYFRIETNLKTPLFKIVPLSLIVICMTIVGCNRPTTGEISVDDKNDSSCSANTDRLMGDTIVVNTIDTTNNKKIIKTTTGTPAITKPDSIKEIPVMGKVCAPPDKK